MNIYLITVNILTLLAFFLHTFIGDKELKLIEPDANNDPQFLKQEKWTMARTGWHWISVDLLLATIGLGIINFTDYLDCKELLLKILAIYFFIYGLVWIIVIAISKDFPKNYLKLGQWGLLWLMSGLIYLGLN
ncbi:MAG: hypothetical protein MK207_09170 [Saprospiraceae bacterium]|nr:hypothetical protein [Saprospiraceae bacterium]